MAVEQVSPQQGKEHGRVQGTGQTSPWAATGHQDAVMWPCHHFLMEPNARVYTTRW
jgi:hypothetical protein